MHREYPSGTYRMGLIQICLSAKERGADGRSPTGAAGSCEGTGLLLCETDGTRDPRETPRDTTAGLPPARAAFVLIAWGRDAAKQTGKKKSITHTDKVCFRP